MSRITKALRLLAAVVVFALPACAQEPPVISTTRSRAFPAEVEAANGTVVVPKRPERIISLSPTATEMLFAIGAGDQVVAVDDQSDFPEGVPTTDLSGLQPNVEAIADRDPDLVVVANDFNEIVKALGALQVPTLLQPAAEEFDDVYEQLDELGTATGHEVEAQRVVSRMRDRIDELVRSAPSADLTYYHELDQKYFTVTSKTFIGQVYSSVGLRNIADAAPGAETLYPQLSAEYIIQADPDFIFLADTECCGQSEETVAARPGWNQLTAVRRGAVVELDDDIASRWGPRVVDFLETVADKVSELQDAPLGAPSEQGVKS